METILAHLAAQIDKLGTAAWDQAPLVYRDIIVAGLISHGLGSVLALALLIAGGWCVRQSIRAAKVPNRTCKTCGHRDDGSVVFAFALGAIGCGVFGLVIGSQTVPSLLAAWLAPRAYLIDYLR